MNKGSDDVQSEAKALSDQGYRHLEAGRLDDALTALERARALAPNDAQIRLRIALVHGDAGRYTNALQAIEDALILDPRNARAHNNRGSMLELLGRVVEARQAFSKAIELDGLLEQPYLNLGHILEREGRYADAIDLYRRAIERGLDRDVFRQHAAAAEGLATDRSPDAWVRKTFDNFAPTFDSHLASLGYRVPQDLASMLRGATTETLDVVDLGCGTGQCGLAFASMKRSLVGVDLSEGMLARARTLNVYDKLICQDIHSWMAGFGSAACDAIVAADVFIYIGELSTLFLEAARLIRPRGYFCFSTEESRDVDYVLQKSGRYAQSEAYIRRLAAPSFAVHSERKVALRMESGAPADGHLYLLQRSS